ncbi:MAG: hypothetical protein SH850_00795, partial [Planctomycetaceae bacterium]|nr:hypothetical protein [Planctomycetaceae bacterium]
THLLSSQSECNRWLSVATFAIDWWETAGIVDWDMTVAKDQFARLHDQLRKAVEAKTPLPFDLPGYSCILHERGMGSGRDSRREFRIEYCGITIGLSTRECSKRQLYNFSCLVPGNACLLVGAAESRKIVQDIVTLLGGTITDEWVRRLDLCLDVPGLSLRDELLPAFEAGQMTTTATRWNSWDGKKGKTGFSVGSRPRLKLNCYDKLLDTIEKQNGVYQVAMQERRWNGVVPEAATRLEYQIGKEWLDVYGLTDAEYALGSMADIVAKLVEKEPRRFFCLLSRKPDRANHHQSREELLPVWAELIQVMLARAGEPSGPLRPIPRFGASLANVWARVRGGIVTASAMRGVYLGSLADAQNTLEWMHGQHGGSDDDWESRYLKRARELGTLDETVSFHPFDERDAA